MKRYKEGYIIGVTSSSSPQREEEEERGQKDGYETIEVHDCLSFHKNGLSVFISLSVLPLPQESWKMAFSWAFISRSWCECPSKPISPSTCISPQRVLDPPLP